MQTNLLPKHRKAALMVRTRARLWLMGGSAYAGIIMAAGLAFALSGPRIAVAAELFERQERELSDRKARVQQLSSETQSVLKKLERLSRIQNHVDVSALVRLITGAQKDQIALDSISLDRTMQQPKEPARKKIGADAKGEAAPAATIVYTIDIAGLAKEQPEVTSFVLRLEQSGLFDKVTVVESGKRDVQGAELAQFRLRCRVEEVPPPQPPAQGGAK